MTSRQSSAKIRFGTCFAVQACCLALLAAAHAANPSVAERMKILEEQVQDLSDAVTLYLPSRTHSQNTETASLEDQQMPPTRRFDEATLTCQLCMTYGSSDWCSSCCEMRNGDCAQETRHREVFSQFEQEGSLHKICPLNHPNRCLHVGHDPMQVTAFREPGPGEPENWRGTQWRISRNPHNTAQYSIQANPELYGADNEKYLGIADRYGSVELNDPSHASDIQAVVRGKFGWQWRPRLVRWIDGDWNSGGVPVFKFESHNLPDRYLTVGSDPTDVVLVDKDEAAAGGTEWSVEQLA